MKIVKIIFCVLAGLYALGHCVYLPKLLLTGAHSSAVLGSLAGLCIGAAISYALLTSAFRKKHRRKGIKNGVEGSWVILNS